MFFKSIASLSFSRVSVKNFQLSHLLTHSLSYILASNMGICRECRGWTGLGWAGLGRVDTYSNGGRSTSFLRSYLE